MQARWFNLYGWDPEEVPDVAAIWRQGERVQPNHFKGRLLVSARADTAHESELGKAGIVTLVAGSFYEPQKVQRNLLVDVYEVIGDVGRECKVSIDYGRKSQQTKTWVVGAPSPREDTASESREKDLSTHESTVQFKFERDTGRIDPLMIMTHEEAESQAKVIINVYTTGILSGQTRVGYTMHALSEVKFYESGTPSLPKYYPLETLPHMKRCRARPSILMTLEQADGEKEVFRAQRRHFHASSYIVRAYMFMARAILGEGGQDYAVRVSCASKSKTTKSKTEVSPLWMECLELTVNLNFDHPHDAPTMEPINLVLCTSNYGNLTDIASTTASYSYMRKKHQGTFEPFNLKPQWVKLAGGAHQGRTEAELLVAFELLRFRDLPELKVKKMWPVSEDEFDPTQHFCKLLKARFDFALYGLRDIVPPSGLKAVMSGCKPVVKVVVKKFVEPSRTSRDFQCEFNYGDISEETGKLREEPWTTNALGHRDCLNYEFMQVKSMDVEIPENYALLEPFFSVNVFWKANTLGSVIKTEPVVGEYRQALREWLPCTWYTQKGDEAKVQVVDFSQKAEAQSSAIRRAMEERSEGEARPFFVEASAEERRQDLFRKRLHSRDKVTLQSSEEPVDKDRVGSDGNPPQFTPKSLLNPIGYTKEEKVKLTLGPNILMNMFRGNGFGSVEGEKLQTNIARAHVVKLEECAEDDKAFPNDFWFANKPLVKKTDFGNLFSDDWNFEHSRCFGFVKFMIKLTDKSKCTLRMGEGENVDPRLFRSLSVSEDIDAKVFGDPLLSEKERDHQFITKFKSALHSNIRVRLYFQSAVCLGAGGAAPNPYPRYILGTTENALKRHAAHESYSAEFREVLEADVSFPRESRLEVGLLDMNTTLISASLMDDSVIGSTVIDLEDRWHSTAWRNESRRMLMPVENRPLQIFSGGRSKNTGSFEMWVDMVNTMQVSTVPLYDMKKVEPLEVEIRIVLWTLKRVPMEYNDTIDIMAKVHIECSTFLGDAPVQETDVHYGSNDGHAVFNWRVVFSRIKLPTSSCLIGVSLYHYSALSPPVNVWQLKLNMRKWLERFAKNKEPVLIDKQIVRKPPPDESENHHDHHNPAQEGEEAEADEVEMLLSVHVISQIEASQRKVGRGRDPPNENPTLSVPEDGRQWGDYFAGTALNLSGMLPSLGLWKKFIPLFLIVLFSLGMLVLLRWLGLL